MHFRRYFHVLTFNSVCITSRLSELIPQKTVDLAVNVLSLTLIHTLSLSCSQSYFKSSVVLLKRNTCWIFTNPCILSNFVDFHAPWTLKPSDRTLTEEGNDKWYFIC